MRCLLGSVLREVSVFLETVSDAYFVLSTRAEEGMCLAVIPLCLKMYPLLHVHGKVPGRLFDYSMSVIKKLYGNLPFISTSHYRLTYVVPEVGEILLIWYLAYLTARNIESDILRLMLIHGVPKEALEFKRKLLLMSWIYGSCRKYYSIIDPGLARKHSSTLRTILRRYVRKISS